MSRNVKIKVAAVVTAVVTTLGTAGLAGAVGSVDAGKDRTAKNGSWCC